MNKLYNSSFEMELRTLMVLYISPLESMSADQIYSFDFICCYGEDFEVSENNLHGDSAYKFGELALRKSVINDAVKDLVVRGMIDVVTGDGFKYKINDRGIEFISSLDNQYSDLYTKIAGDAFTKYGKLTEQELLAIINKAAMGRNK
ncbi:MAG: hypothetical protein LKG11_02660 [Bacilli bacterium]|nr:hypothetical protein [Bacilli bacterium]